MGENNRLTFFEFDLPLDSVNLQVKLFVPFPRVEIKRIQQRKKEKKSSNNSNNNNKEERNNEQHRIWTGNWDKLAKNYRDRDKVKLL